MEIHEEIQNAFSRATRGDGFGVKVNLCELGGLLGGKAFVAKYRMPNLRSLLEKFAPAIVLEVDNSHQAPVVYATMVSELPKLADLDEIAQAAADQELGSSAEREPDRILDFAYMPHAKYEELAEMAIRERWTLPGKEDVLELGLLKSYIDYTYRRLSFEGKVMMRDDKYAAFNTGLLDDRYLPIFALFERNTPDRSQRWKLKAFCIEGEDAGKLLVANFSPLPERAEYITDPRDIFYDQRAGKPHIDYDHIIIENAERLPFTFFQALHFTSFVCKECSSMTREELALYKEELKAALKETDRDAYRIAKMYFDSALEEAMNRVRRNYKAAIPIYHHPKKTICLLLPLRLNKRSNKADVALVVERQATGGYSGHTILTLEMAYQNARLICAPDTNWLTLEG